MAERGLDFASAHEVFSGPTLTVADERFEYGEARYVTVGVLNGRLVVLAWTQRGDICRISMRKANEREIDKFSSALD